MDRPQLLLPQPSNSALVLDFSFHGNGLVAAIACIQVELLHSRCQGSFMLSLHCDGRCLMIRPDLPQSMPQSSLVGRLHLRYLGFALPDQSRLRRQRFIPLMDRPQLLLPQPSNGALVFHRSLSRCQVESLFS